MKKASKGLGFDIFIIFIEKKMRGQILIFLLNLLSVNQFFSQSSGVIFHVDTPKMYFIDTNMLFDYKSDFKIILRIDTDFVANRKFLHVVISNSKSHYTVKKYDVEKNSLIEILNEKEFKNTIFLHGYFYRYLVDSNLIIKGKYKKDYFDGEILSKDTSGNLVSRQKCCSQRKICKVKEYYNDRIIKKTYHQKFNTLFFGSYKEYYPNGKIKIKGKYKILKIKDPSELREYNIKNIIWVSKNKGYVSFKTGNWYFYNEEGKIEAKEHYQYGRKL